MGVNTYYIWSFLCGFRLMVSSFLLRAQEKGTKEKGTQMSYPAGAWIHLDDQRAVHRLIPDPVD